MKISGAKDQSDTGLPQAAGKNTRSRTGWPTLVAVGSAVFCILGLSAWQIWSSYREAVSDMEVLSTALARVSEEQVTGLLRGIDVVLAEMVELAPDDKTGGRGGAGALLSSRMKQFPYIRNALLTDQKGMVTFGTVSGMAGIDVHDREYFTTLSEDPSRRLVITPPLKSRALNVFSIFVARAIRNSRGVFQGVAVIAIDPGLFDDALRSVVPASGGRAALIRDDGIVLARQPASGTWSGMSVADGEVFRAVQGGSASGALFGRGKTDGAERVVSYRRSETYPLIVAVGMTTGPALKSWRMNSTLHGGVALALALALIGAAILSDRRHAERLRGQMALAASEARFRLLNDRSPVGIVQADAEGHCLYANERWLDLTGRSRSELIGHKWCDVVVPQDREAVALAWGELARQGGQITKEMRISAPDGSIRWVLGHASQLGAAQDGAGLVVTFEDITATREANQRLALSEEKFAKAFQGSPDALVISTVTEGSYVEVNKAFCRLLGYSRPEFMGSDAKTLRIWANPEDRDRLVAAVTRDGQVEDFETVLRRKDSTTMIVLVSVQQIMVAGELCLLFICRDVSERREMEARTQRLLVKLDASNKELEQFAYVTSHDLQEPLRMIAGYAQLIERRYRGKLDADADEFIGFLVDGAKRMQGMILDLLDYSRVDRRGGEFIHFDGGAALEEVRLNLSAALAETGGRIEIGPMPEVTADRSQFVRLFQNLIGNALKYRHAERVPEIRVDAQATAEGWQFSVADNGIGIGAEYFERIFQVFQRLHTRERYQGSGIGLAICKKIVERHGGRIWVESTPETGSVFRFTLPVRFEWQDAGALVTS